MNMRCDWSDKNMTPSFSALGLRAEISTSWDFYVKQFGAIIEELPNGGPFDYMYGLYQSYFTVYESNASLLGQIPDDNLRQAIVATYAVARRLIDTHLLNNPAPIS
jgi:hypothetical protein